MTDLRQLLDLPGSEAARPDLDELWTRGRQRRQRRRLARVAIPVVVLLAIGLGVVLAVLSDDRSELETIAEVDVPAVSAERVWVIPRLIDGPLEAEDILFETVDSSFITSLRNVEDPDLRILLFRQEAGVFEASGDPVDINDTPGYLRTTRQGTLAVVDIEWQVDGLWQVFQVTGASEDGSIDAARLFEAEGVDSLTANGWELLAQEPSQEQITIIGNFGVFIFQDEQGPLLGAEVKAESNGFTVYGIGPDDVQLFVEYQGRIIFSYAAGVPNPIAVTPSGLTETLEIVTEQEWRDWLTTWSLQGVEIDETQIPTATSSWVNQLGLNRTDVATWTTRFRLACSRGVWEPDVARELAEDFIREDLPFSVRSPDLGEPSTDEAAQVLWTMTVQVCRDAFPPGAIESGPPRP